jgi:hypothetical protein
MPGDRAPPSAGLSHRGGRPCSGATLYRCCTLPSFSSRGRSLDRRVLLGAARALPGLARRSRELTGTLGLAFGLFEAFARALELVLRDAYALLGDVGLQPHPLGRFGRRTLVAACLLHPLSAKRKRTSLTQGLAGFHPG